MKRDEEKLSHTNERIRCNFRLAVSEYPSVAAIACHKDRKPWMAELSVMVSDTNDVQPERLNPLTH